MDPRPAYLPNFKLPPVQEVVLGIQFAELTQLRTVHAGLFWNRIRPKFGKSSEHPPLAKAFELFGGLEHRSGISPVVELIQGAPFHRYWFVDNADAEIIQLQRDKLFHNWRKTGPGIEYPHYEQIAESFKGSVALLETFLKDENLGTIECNQCEVSYINHIAVEEPVGFSAAVQRVFGHWHRLSDAAGLEDVSFVLNYHLRDGGEPVGRLHVTMQPAYQPDGSPIIVLNLTARGRPLKVGSDGYLGFMARARDAIVLKFTELTSDEMHKRWGRMQ